MKIYSVYDKEFKPYGKVLGGYDTAELIEAMKKIDLPDSIVQIDLDAFTECRELEEINFSKAEEFMHCFLQTPFSRKGTSSSGAPM